MNLVGKYTGSRFFGPGELPVVFQAAKEPVQYIFCFDSKDALKRYFGDEVPFESVMRIDQHMVECCRKSHIEIRHVGSL